MLDEVLLYEFLLELVELYLVNRMLGIIDFLSLGFYLENFIVYDYYIC